MKQILQHPLTLLTIAAAGLFGCATSTPPTANTDTEVTITQTETMAGQTTEPVAATEAIQDTAEIDYSQMFAGVENTADYTLAELTTKDPNLSTFSTLIEQAELADALQTEKGFTLFAPTNQAFSNWPQDSLNMLMKTENKAQLIKLLQAHLLTIEIKSASLRSGQRLESGGGEYITVDVADDSSIIVGGATIVRPDVKASNGVLHIMNGLIKPVENTLERH